MSPPLEGMHVTDFSHDDVLQATSGMMSLGAPTEGACRFTGQVLSELLAVAPTRGMKGRAAK